MKKLFVITLALLNIALFSHAELSLAEEPQRHLSEDQDFIITDDAETREYVGIVKAYPEYHELGDLPVFILKNNVDDIYAVDSQTGRIIIADNALLSKGYDVITVTINKAGYQSTDIKVTINVLDNNLCTFVDPDSSTNDVGTRSKPRNTLPDWDEYTDDMIILIKRGSCLTVPSIQYIHNKNNIMIASYGIGDLPLFSTANGGYVFRIWSNIPEQGPENFIIRDIACSSNEVARNNPTANYGNWGAGLCYTSNTKIMFSILHCELFKINNGFTVNSPLDNQGDNISVKWNYIHDVSQEGIYIQNNSGSVYCSANKIKRNNLKWFFDKDQTVSQGDQIQLVDNREVFVRNNYLDKSYTGNKFNVIAQYSRRVMDGTEWIDISNNYMIGNIGGDPAIANGISGALIYADFPMGLINGNTLIASAPGKNRAISGPNAVDITISNNIIKDMGDAVVGSNLKIYNNLMYNCETCVVSGDNEFINNIIYFSEAGQRAYAHDRSIKAHHNLYNTEQMDMFQSNTETGYDSLSSVQPFKEAGSVIGDPLFEDELNNDFRINVNSPAYGRGVVVPVYGDFYSRLKDNAPDIGIYQVDEVENPQPFAYNLYFTGAFSKNEIIALNYMVYDVHHGNEGDTKFKWYRSSHPYGIKIEIPDVSEQSYQLTPEDVGMVITAKIFIESDAMHGTGTAAEITSEHWVSNIPALKVTDNFEDYPGQFALSDSDNWTDLRGNIQLIENSGNTEVIATGNTHEIAIWSADKMHNNQYAKIEKSNHTRGGYNTNSGVVVRASGGGNALNCYVLTQCNDWARLGKWVAGDYTELATPNPVPQGTVLELRAVGNELTVWANGFLDTSIGVNGIIIDDDINSGSIGLYVHGESPYQKLDNFEGGNVYTESYTFVESDLSVTDNFETYAADTALSDSFYWTDLQGNMQLVDTNGNIELLATGNSHEITVWSADELNDDQYAKVKKSFHTRGGFYVNSGVVVRASGSGDTLNCYVLTQCNEWTRLGKWVDGVYMELAVPRPINRGGTLELRVIDNELSVWANGVRDTSIGNNGIITDSDITSGSVGLYVHGGSPYQRLDNFEGGNL